MPGLSSTTETKTYILNWNNRGVQDVEDWFQRQRLTQKQAVVIKVTHFNTLFYRLVWTEKDTTDKAYAELSDRWAKVLPILGLVFPAAGPGGATFVDPTNTFSEWLVALTTTESQLSCLLNAYSGRTAIASLDGPVYGVTDSHCGSASSIRSAMLS